MQVKFGDTEFTIVRVDDNTIRLTAHQTTGNHRQVIVTEGTPDESEALKNALEEVESVRSQPR